MLHGVLIFVPQRISHPYSVLYESSLFPLLASKVRKGPCVVARHVTCPRRSMAKREAHSMSVRACEKVLRTTYPVLYTMYEVLYSVVQMICTLYAHAHLQQDFKGLSPGGGQGPSPVGMKRGGWPSRPSHRGGQSPGHASQPRPSSGPFLARGPVSWGILYAVTRDGGVPTT
jgi:hypothetical protein